uniref:Uncharacterized protein n=1 Tax=Anopheles albimanus TaxID=7167 RepID=A0A182FHZ9_ANOAL
MAFASCFAPQNLSWCEGWPLAVPGALVLHLGAIDESLVRAQDTYLCIRPEQDTSKAELYAVWRGATSAAAAAPSAANTEPIPSPPSSTSSPPSSSIVYRRLDPLRDPITPLAVEMLTEDLAGLLQNLLVGIERAISRVPLEDLSFPLAPAAEGGGAGEPDETAGSLPAEPGDAEPGGGGVGGRYIVCPGTPKIGLKRRELITKNNNSKLLISSKYTQLKHRPSATTVTATSGANGTQPVVRQVASPGATPAQPGSDDSSAANQTDLRKSENPAPIIIGGSVSGNQRNDGLNVTICDTGGAGGAGGAGGGDNHQSHQSALADIGASVGGQQPQTTTTTSATTSSLPLFCLGGSFPHIDSDEESSDDQKKVETPGGPGKGHRKTGTRYATTTTRVHVTGMS